MLQNGVLVLKKKNSLLKAYYRLIEGSKYYIYIENQFFISKAFSKEKEGLNDSECDHLPNVHI